MQRVLGGYIYRDSEVARIVVPGAIVDRKLQATIVFCRKNLPAATTDPITLVANPAQQHTVGIGVDQIVALGDRKKDPAPYFGLCHRASPDQYWGQR